MNRLQLVVVKKPKILKLVRPISPFNEEASSYPPGIIQISASPESERKSEERIRPRNQPEILLNDFLAGLSED